MHSAFLQILLILGSLGLFLYGMKTMSEALQKVAGGRMRHTLDTLAPTTGRRILAGTAITAVLQSSSAVTVMIVSFVNAGLLTLTQSVGMIMGANIGTTATAWIIALFGFKMDLGLAAIPLVAVGFPMLMLRTERWRAAGSFIIGFALLLLAIRSLDSAFGDLATNPTVIDYLSHLSRPGFLPLIIFAGIGMLLTVVVQSSSATMALTLVLCGGGWLPFDCGAAMILGENVGTTSTANIAALVTGTGGKRAALIHTLFNVIGLVWALPLLPFITEGICLLFAALGGASPCRVPTATPIALALFHTTFNLINTLLLVGFIPQLVRLTERIVPDRKTAVQTPKLRFLDSALLSTGSISIVQAGRELKEYALRTSRMFHDVQALFRQTNSEAFHRLYAGIERQETQNDLSRSEFYTFLGRASRENIGADAKRDIEILFRLVSDIEIMSDYNYSIAKLIRTKKERGIWFAPAMREGVNRMLALTGQAVELMNRNIARPRCAAADLSEALETEQHINTLRTSLREECLGREQDEEAGRQAGIIFSDLITRIEQLADIVVRISEDATQFNSDHE